MDATQVLVIILSAFLALFLLLAIVLIVLLIKVTKQIKSVTTAAKGTVDLANNFVSTATKATAPAILSKYIAEGVTSFISKKRKK